MERRSEQRRGRLLLVAAGCVIAAASAAVDGTSGATAGASATVPGAVATGTAARDAAPARPTTRTGSPLRGARPADDAPTAGRIAERIAAGPYTYLRIATADGDAWLATLGRGAHPGDEVAIHTLGTRRDFVSRRLGRTFSTLHFAVVTTHDEETRR